MIQFSALILAGFVTQTSAIGEFSTAYNDSSFQAHKMGVGDVLLADGMLTLRAGFAFAAESDKTRHILEYRAGYQAFVKHSEQNSQEHRADWTSEFDLSERWTLRLANRFMYANANSVAELGSPVFIGQQAVTATPPAQLGATHFIENAARLGFEYNVEERWQATPEVGIETFEPLDVVGNAEVPITNLAYHRFRLSRNYVSNRFYVREEQTLLMPPAGRDKQLVSAAVGGWSHQFTTAVEGRIELGGNYTTNLTTSKSTPSPLVGLLLQRRDETLNIELAAGFENTVNIEFGSLSDVYYADAALTYNINHLFAVEAASGYRRQLIENPLRVGTISVNQMDVTYAMAGAFFHLTPELTIFGRFLYRYQFAQALDSPPMMPVAPFEPTFDRKVAVVGLRMEWPPLVQRRIRN